jgi:hypothetical protein
MAENQSEQTIETSVEATTTESSNGENLSEVKKLSPEEEAVLEKKRSVFRKLHEYFLDAEIYSVSPDTSATSALIEAAFEKLQKEVFVSSLKLSVDGKDMEKLKELLDIFSETTVNDALDFLRVLGNAVDHERIQKTKDWKVKDLEITIL